MVDADSIKRSALDFLRREDEVLVSGLTDAVTDAWNSGPTWEGFKTAARNTGKSLIADPLGTLGNGLKATWNYGTEHIEDATAGALLAIVNPRGWIANTALGLWSTRGLWSSTFSSGYRAAYSSADTKALRQQFRADLDHEGKSFVTSLPMTVLGSMAGRATADAVFGHDLALSNLDLRSPAPKVEAATLPDLSYTFEYGKVSFVPHELNPAIRKVVFEPNLDFAARASKDLSTTGKLNFKPDPQPKLDPSTARISRDQLNTNILSKLDAWQMKKMLLHDLDNTAYCFPEGFLGRERATDNIPGEGIEKGIKLIQQKLADRGVVIDEREVMLKMGETMDQNRTHNGAWQVQESPMAKMFPGTPQEFKVEIVDPFWEIMDASREKYLKAMEGAKQELARYTRKGGIVVGWSDGDVGTCIHSLKITGLDEYITHLYATEMLRPQPGSLDPIAMSSGLDRVSRLLNMDTKLVQITQIPRHATNPFLNFEKPHPGGIDLPIKDLGFRPSQVAVYDDSRVKGAGAANNATGGPIDIVWFAGSENAYDPVYALLSPQALTRGPSPHRAPYTGKADIYSDINKYLYPSYMKLTGNLLSAPLHVTPRWNALAGYNLFPWQTTVTTPKASDWRGYLSEL